MAMNLRLNLTDKDAFLKFVKSLQQINTSAMIELDFNTDKMLSKTKNDSFTTFRGVFVKMSDMFTFQGADNFNFKQPGVRVSICLYNLALLISILNLYEDNFNVTLQFNSEVPEEMDRITDYKFINVNTIQFASDKLNVMYKCDYLSNFDGMNDSSIYKHNDSDNTLVEWQMNDLDHSKITSLLKLDFDLMFDFKYDGVDLIMYGPDWRYKLTSEVTKDCPNTVEKKIVKSLYTTIGKKDLYKISDKTLITEQPFSVGDLGAGREVTIISIKTIE